MYLCKDVNVNICEYANMFDFKYVCTYVNSVCMHVNMQMRIDVKM